VTTLRAVLFDMDGTLTDSEKLWTIALDQTAADLGGRLSVAAREAMVGHDMADSIRMLLADLGVQRPADEVAGALTGHTATLFAGAVPWRPGAQQLLQQVRAAGLATALVTATHRELVDLALNTLGRSNFDAVVCGDEVTANKPHPGPYQRAMELLQVSADESIAVEDSPNGSASALAAGVPVLLVPSEIEVAERPGMTFARSLTEVSVSDLRRIRTAAVPADQNV
jgi:HAD superfamily hydrolase (TIGR01509 family)